MAHKLNIFCSNCQGLNNEKKRIDVFEKLKKKNGNIYCLQDTHFTKDLEQKIKLEWGSSEVRFCSFSSQSRGVAILFQDNFEFEILQEIKDEENGNYIILRVKLEDETITIANIYGPNTDTPEFYHKIKNIVKSLQSERNIICGDFNLVQDQSLDTFNYLHVNNPRSKEAVLDMMEELSLYDPWRANNVNVHRYTWRKSKPLKQARLDFFLVSENMEQTIINTKIEPSYRSDHSVISIQIEFTKIEKGRGFWKFNNSLLQDPQFVKEIKKIIQETVDEYHSRSLEGERVLMINEHIFFEILLCNIRGYAIKYSSYKKKERFKAEIETNKILEDLETKLDTAVNEDYKAKLITDINELKDQQLELNKYKTEGIILRSKAKWYEQGEKPTKYFLSLEKQNFQNKAIAKLETAQGVITETEDIKEHAKNYFQNLYTSKNVKDVELEDIFKNCSIPKITDEEALSLEGELQYDEVLACLKNMKNNKSPGPSGFTAEFYKFFWLDINKYLINSLNHAFKTGELSISQKQGLITCIPKPDKPRDQIKNYRPISLLNTSYKLASSVIAARIKRVLPKIISDDQKGFMKGRYIGECTRLVSDIMEYTDFMNIPGLLIMIDFEKAFDSVEWSFIEKCLNFFNFGSSIKEWIKTFYNNINSSVLINGFASDFFRITRGCRQGDPLSPYIFLIVAEILAHMLRQNDKVKGITMFDLEYLLTQFADDTTIILDGSERSFQTALDILNYYASFSGLKINIDKTKVVWIGSKQFSSTQFCKDYNLDWTQRPFKLLGILFQHNKAEMVERNYKDKLKKVDKLMNLWSLRDLTPLGRITVLKSLILPTLNHLFSSLPNPKISTIQMLQKKIFAFIWRAKPDKIKRSLIVKNYKQGGLKVPDILETIKSQKISWIRRLFTTNSKFNTILQIFSKKLNPVEMGSVYLKKHVIPKIKNIFWRDVFDAWADLQERYDCNKLDFSKQYIWANNNIKIGGNPVLYENYLRSNVKYISDLLKEDNSFLSFAELQKIYGVETNFLEYAGIVSSIKRYSNEVNILLVKHKNLPFIPPNVKVLYESVKGCNNFYRILLKKCNSITLGYKHKWEKDLNQNFSKETWTTYHYMPFRASYNTKERWFQYRIVHRILTTNKDLYNYNMITSPLCTFCKTDKETIIHLMFECRYVNRLWQNLLNWIENKTDTLITLDPKTTLLGYTEKRNDVLNLIFLVTKEYIYSRKHANVFPTLDGLKVILQHRYNIHKCNAYTECKYNKFMTFWSSCHNLFT